MNMNNLTLNVYDKLYFITTETFNKVEIRIDNTSLTNPKLKGILISK